jgi:hypothetical protein
MESGLKNVFMIKMGKDGGNGKKEKNDKNKKLCKWREVKNKKGIV